MHLLSYDQDRPVTPNSHYVKSLPAMREQFVVS